MRLALAGSVATASVKSGETNNKSSAHKSTYPPSRRTTVVLTLSFRTFVLLQLLVKVLDEKFVEVLDIV